MKRYLSFIVLAVFLFSLSLACRFLPVVPGGAQPATPTTPANLPSQPIVPDIAAYQDTLIGLYEKAAPGVVSIRVLTQAGEALGSGFVYDTEGRIITNYHVVEGFSDFEVDFPSGIKVRGTIQGTDLDSDLAVIKVNVPADQLFPLPLGDSEQVKVGQAVVAIGNPFGLSSSMTTGIVSAIGRTLPSMHTAPGGGNFTAGDIIQTDTAINPGNSGGPLLNLAGEVIGVNRAIRTESFSTSGEPVNSGIGFAVSVNTVKRVVPSLIEKGSFDYPYLGISSFDEITLTLQEALDLPQATGAYVSEVTANSPAERAGLIGGSEQSDLPNILKGGDLITAVDGHEVRSFAEMLSYLINYRSPGDTVTMTFLRSGQQMEVQLTLERRP